MKQKQCDAVVQLIGDFHVDIKVKFENFNRIRHVFHVVLLDHNKYSEIFPKGNIPCKGAIVECPIDERCDARAPHIPPWCRQPDAEDLNKCKTYTLYLLGPQ